MRKASSARGRPTEACRYVYDASGAAVQTGRWYHSPAGRSRGRTSTTAADLEVYDEAGTLLGSSTSGGKRSETVDLTVPAGHFELRAYSRAGEFSPEHPHRVNVTALG